MFRFKHDDILRAVIAFNETEKIMHALLLPILADVDPGVTSSGAVVLLILSVAAIIRSKMK